MARRAKKRGKQASSKETTAASSPGRIRLEKELEVELPDGSVVKLRPGPYKKGIAIVPVSSSSNSASGGGAGRSGRKPRPGTVRLRGRLQKDVQQGIVQKPKVYVEWLMGIDPGLSVSSARQIVYRERRIAIEGE